MGNCSSKNMVKAFVADIEEKAAVEEEDNPEQPS